MHTKNNKLKHGNMGIVSEIYKWDYKWECNALIPGLY